MKIIIVGAGAAGLMAARELAKNGHEVTVLEARDRVGGRIWSLDQEKFGYPAQAGAEFVHGSAQVTKKLLQEAGLHYVSMAEDGEMMTVENGEVVVSAGDPLEESELVAHRRELNQKLQDLKTDLPIAEFLLKNFGDQKYAGMREWINRMVQGFDAADPEQISTFSLRDEWLGQAEWEQGRVKEGYKAVLDFLEAECRKFKVEILLGQKVEAISDTHVGVKVAISQKTFEADKVIVTVPLPVISQIHFEPALPKKIKAASDIGFGQVIKILIRFDEIFWAPKMTFLFSSEQVGTWWTQYPEQYLVLTGWIAGPRALNYKNKTDQELFDLAVESLANIFKIPNDQLKFKIKAYHIANWPADSLAMGAYSYSKAGSESAYAELREPVADKIYFAGEAIYLEKETATVEGALASGLETAKKIMSS